MKTQTRTSGTDAATLGLGSVLVGSLPAALMTDEAPDRYTVEAVFTRRPEPDEVAAIHGRQTREFLTQAGYPMVEVTVSDRRLEIANTTLEELRDGLGSVLAERIAGISASVHEAQDAAAERFRAAAATELAREVRVAALAESVAFGRVPESERAAASSVDKPARRDVIDRAQINAWMGEGGSTQPRV